MDSAPRADTVPAQDQQSADLVARASRCCRVARVVSLLILANDIDAPPVEGGSTTRASSPPALAAIKRMLRNGAGSRSGALHQRLSAG